MTTLLAAYSYNALNRRIIEDDGSTPTHLFYSANWQVLEEQVSGQTTTQYVWSPVYIDALILRDRDTDSDGDLDERLYVQQDANFNVTALVNTSGTVVQRFVYDPYGQDQVLTANWTQTTDNYGWWYRFQGGRLEKSTGLYNFQRRDYSPTQGRWIEEDPIGIRGGDNNFYRFEGNNPVVRVDPTGEFWHILGGAAIGLAVGLGGQLISDVVSGNGLSSWQTYVGAGLGGAAGGAVFAATGSTVAAGAAAGFVSSVTTQGLTNGVGNIDLNQAVVSGAAGALMGGVGAKVSGVINAGVGRAFGTNLGQRLACNATLGQTMRGLTARTVSGAGSGVVMDSISQSVEILTSDEPKGWNWKRTVAAAASGGAISLGSALLFRVCFAGDTPLLTPDGHKRIDEFKEGDFVLSRSEYDPNGPVEAKRVEEIFVRLARIFHLYIGGRVIRTTQEHPFYVLGKGWTATGELKKGDVLLSHDGQRVLVEGLLDTGEWETVYNLRVADYHTYFVGDSTGWGFSVWAHNQCVPNPDGQHGKLDHRNTVKALVTKAETEFKGQNVVIQHGKSIRSATGVNRCPDVSVLDADGKVLKVYEAARTTSAGFVPRELAKRSEYIAAGIASYFKKV